MGSDLGYGATGTGFSYSSPFQAPPSMPNRLFGSLKFDTRSSPSSPFSAQFDCDTVTSLTDHSQEHYSSSDNLSGVSPSENLQLFSGQTSFLEDANSSASIKQALQQLESVLMGPDEDDAMTPSNASMGETSAPPTPDQKTTVLSEDRQSSHVLQPQVSFHLRQRLSGEMEESTLDKAPPGSLKELLIACARALAENNVRDFDRFVEQARGAVSISGEPIQRLGAYLVEALVARTQSSGANIYRTLKCREPESKELLSYMHVLYEIFPYLRFGYMAANGAIADACRN